MESDNNFSNNRVPLPHIVQVQHTMVAQGHYLHIVKGCVNRAFGEWEIITATKESNGLWPNARSSMHTLSEIEGFYCHINANGRLACRDIVCNHGSNKNFTPSNPFSVLLSMMCSGQNHTNPTQNYNFRHNSFNVVCN